MHFSFRREKILRTSTRLVIIEINSPVSVTPGLSRTVKDLSHLTFVKVTILKLRTSYPTGMCHDTSSVSR